MSSILLYLLKSTIIVGLLCLLYRLLLHREASFSINRKVLLLIIVFSVIVPLIPSPQILSTPIQMKLIPELAESRLKVHNLPINILPQNFQPNFIPDETKVSSNELTLSVDIVLFSVYVLGVVLSLIILGWKLIALLLFFRRFKSIKMKGYRLVIVKHDVPSFAFLRTVVISESDHNLHGNTILAHELAHIRKYHFIDIVVLEFFKIFHWFNPAIYAMISDMKEIHEFQADNETILTGVNLTQYQLLIIQKGVGTHKFALANCFNNCQIKNRITMINKSKTSKAWRWKVATFLPLLALLLMAFSKSGENVSAKEEQSNSEEASYLYFSEKRWVEADFEKITFKDRVKLFNENKNAVAVLMNSKSQLMVKGNRCEMAAIPKLIRNFRDFEQTQFSSDFVTIIVDGKEFKKARLPIIVHKDIKSDGAEFQKLLNAIGNTVYEVKSKYSSKLFGIQYNILDEKQRNEIDMLIPFEVFIEVPDKNIKGITS